MRIYPVASFTGAWIETSNPFRHGCNRCVASFTGAWIETGTIGYQYRDAKGRILYGCVD